MASKNDFDRHWVSPINFNWLISISYLVECFLRYYAPCVPDYRPALTDTLGPWQPTMLLPEGRASPGFFSSSFNFRPQPDLDRLARFDARIDSVSALLAGCDKAAGWALIIDGTHSAAGKDHVDLAEPA
jgi:hypothetical protein